jgi:hypothetical protein
VTLLHPGPGWGEALSARKARLLAQGMKNVDPEESRIFWMALYINPLAWVLMAIVALVKFELDYLMIVAVALVLSVSNIIGYTKCRKGTCDPCTQRHTFGPTSLTLAAHMFLRALNRCQEPHFRGGHVVHDVGGVLHALQHLTVKK